MDSPKIYQMNFHKNFQIVLIFGWAQRAPLLSPNGPNDTAKGCSTPQKLVFIINQSIISNGQKIASIWCGEIWYSMFHAILQQFIGWVRSKFEYVLECYVRELSDSTIWNYIFVRKSNSTRSVITTSLWLNFFVYVHCWIL